MASSVSQVVLVTLVILLKLQIGQNAKKNAIHKNQTTCKVRVEPRAKTKTDRFSVSFYQHQMQTLVTHMVLEHHMTVTVRTLRSNLKD